ncbi:MAG: dockerin type I domain-containing protein, partial [Verrucomicrobiota bacterium]|nr:dockerin type I domain-containing protein [Verrucomicrobiota bacterium]
NLTGVTNAQTLVVNLTGVSDGTLSGSVPVAMSVLIGDTSGDGVVNAGDSLQTRSHAGQATDATNYRFDINNDGVINSGDSIIVRSRSGTSLP